MAQSASALDTFPKYLLRNAEHFGSRPAMRHKDYGIWQSWTWQQQLEEIRAFALGLLNLGFEHGDKVAVVGANRPRLYWTFTAVQSLGGIPVPFYADAVAEEMSYVLDHAGVRFAVVQDQEQVDKLLSFAERMPALTDIIYDEKRGLEGYRSEALHDFAEIQARGRTLIDKDASAASAWEKMVRTGSGEDVSIMLYTSGTTGRSKGVMIKAAAAVNAAIDTARFDKLTENDSVLAYLPLAWVGDHYLNYAQGYVAGFCMNCPESQQTVPQDLREIGPTYYFAPPRVFESLLTSVTIRMEDAGRFKNGCSALSSMWLESTARRSSKSAPFRFRGVLPTPSGRCFSTVRSRTFWECRKSALPTLRGRRLARICSPSSDPSASISSSFMVRQKRFFM